MRGLVREVLGIGAWVGPIVAASGRSARDARHRADPGSAADWVDPVGFVVVFLIALIVLMLIARGIGALRAQIGARRV